MYRLERIITNSLKYKKLLILFLCVSILLPIFSLGGTTAFAATKGVCTASKLMIRSGPGTGYDAIKVGSKEAYLTQNQTVEILGTESGWYKIKATFEGSTVEGYSLATHIKKTADTAAATTQKGICTAGTLMIRKGAGTSYDKVTVNGTEVYLTNGQSVDIIESQNGWYKIKAVFSGTTVEGYSSADYIKVVSTTPTPTAAAKPTTAPTATPKQATASTTTTTGYELKQAAKVTSSTLNVRETAGTSGKKLTTLSKNAAVTIIGQTKSGSEIWYKITTKVSGKWVTGYVLSDYVKITVGSGFYANILQNGLTPVTTAGGTKNLKLSDGTVWKVSKGVIWVSDEVIINGKKWFRIGKNISGTVFRGYITADKLELLGKKIAVAATPTPTATPKPTATQAPTATPKPTATPTPIPPVTLTTNRGSVANANSLVIRSTAGYSGDVVSDNSGTAVLLSEGHALNLLSATRLDGVIWYEISFTYRSVEYNGYINEKYVTLSEAEGTLTTPTPTPVVNNSMDFEAELTAQGFPESYKTALRALHAIYPNWKFEAYQTGLDWNTVIASEKTPGTNLIPNSKGIEWKSLESGAYNWKTDSFIVYDGSTWVTASKEAIEYYMDPRNFLDEKSIFQFEVLTYQTSYQNLTGVENILKYTPLYQTSFSYKDTSGQTKSITYGETFIKAAEYSGVSPYHLASRVKQEVVTGTTALSNSVSGTVSGFEGYYNFYNIGAYHSTALGGAIANGLKYAMNGTTNAALNTSSLIPWNNRYSSIVGGAYIIGNSYINKGQDTIYLQKFNVTPTSTYSHQYMANVEAPYSESKKVYTAYTNIAELPLVFSIPVYKNMPSQAVSVPATKRSPNNWLSTLAINNMSGENLNLTPAFDISADKDYNLVVENNLEMINLTAKAVSSKATVSGVGYYNLNVGENLCVVSVTAENGDIRNYNITIIREN